MGDILEEQKRQDASAIIIIVCLGLLAYSNTFLSPFHFDDKSSIIDNPAIRDLTQISHIWNYLPRRFLLYLSLAVNYHFGQFHVLGYHLFNLAVHLSSAILVRTLVLFTFKTPALKNQSLSEHATGIAFWSALIFVIHPIQTEAVTYIVQRAASMATLFYLASLCLYIRFRLMGDKASYVCSFMAAIGAMFTKEIAITLPVILLIYEASFFEPKWKDHWKRLTPFFLTMILIPLVMLVTEKGRPPESAGIAPGIYLLTQFHVICAYIKLLFLPLHLNIDHDMRLSRTLFEPLTGACLMVLLTILWLTKRLFLKDRLLSFCLLWFLITLLPESSFLPIKDVMAEHRLYLPSVGYSIFFVTGLYCFFRRFPALLTAVLTVLVIGYSFLTFQRNLLWQDDLLLWNDAVRQSPDKARPYTNRGSNYGQRGKINEAIADFNKALQIDPLNVESYDNRGMMYFEQEKLQSAMDDFNKEIELRPNSPTGYNNRGFIYYAKGDFEEALKDFNKAIEIHPQYAKPYNNRGLIESAKGEMIQARDDFSKAIGIDPLFADAYNNRAVLNAQEGKLGLALEDYTKAIELNPYFGKAFINRASVNYQLKNYDKVWNDVDRAAALGVSDQAFQELLLKELPR